MKTRFLFPIVYFAAALVSLLVLGAAGHGPGIGVFFLISLPSILIAIGIDKLLPDLDVTVWLGIVLGIAQYALLGYWWERLRSAPGVR